MHSSLRAHFRAAAAAAERRDNSFSPLPPPNPASSIPPHPTPPRSAPSIFLPHCLIPKGEIVHAPLARRASPEAPQDDVRHALGREYVSAYHRCRWGRVQKRPRRDADLHRCEASLKRVLRRVGEEEDWGGGRELEVGGEGMGVGFGFGGRRVGGGRWGGCEPRCRGGGSTDATQLLLKWHSSLHPAAQKTTNPSPSS